MSFLILFVFSPCPAEEEEWESSWVAVWPLAKVNSPHCVGLDFSQRTGNLQRHWTTSKILTVAVILQLCIQEKTQVCAEPCWFQCTCLQVQLLYTADLAGASEAPPEHKAPPASRQLQDWDHELLKWTWSQYNCQRHMNQNKKISLQLAHNHLAIWSSKYYRKNLLPI